MAGTTVQDQQEVERCFLAAADRTGLEIRSEQLLAMMGLSKKWVFETLWAEQIGSDHPSYNAQVEASFAQFKTLLEDHYSTQHVLPTEGCLELFTWLKHQGIKIALTTGFYRQVTNIILQRLGWHEGLNENYVGNEQSIIQASITPSEIFAEEGRPAPFMIQKAMYRLGITDSKCVVNIGDTPADLKSGINANCLFSWGVTNGTHTREQLAEHPNDGLFDSLLDIQKKLTNLSL